MEKIDHMVSRMIDYALENPEKAPSKVLVISMSKKSLEKILTLARLKFLKEDFIENYYKLAIAPLRGAKATSLSTLLLGDITKYRAP